MDSTDEIIRLKARVAELEAALGSWNALPKKSGMPAVWFIWGVDRVHRNVELVATATSEEKCNGYFDGAVNSGRYVLVQKELVVLDHAYARGMLNELNKILRSPPG